LDASGPQVNCAKGARAEDDVVNAICTDLSLESDVVVAEEQVERFE
jgi:hypothetical protein